ncbi:hypothetical protein Droror1_Dr00013156 [Drosera rotundifolia]
MSFSFLKINQFSRSTLRIFQRQRSPSAAVQDLQDSPQRRSATKKTCRNPHKRKQRSTSTINQDKVSSKNIQQQRLSPENHNLVRRGRHTTQIHHTISPHCTAPPSPRAVRRLAINLRPATRSNSSHSPTQVLQSPKRRRFLEAIPQRRCFTSGRPKSTVAQRGGEASPETSSLTTSKNQTPIHHQVRHPRTSTKLHHHLRPTTRSSLTTSPKSILFSPNHPCSLTRNLTRRGGECTERGGLTEARWRRCGLM